MGGKAFAEVTRRVSRDEVFSTLNWLKANWQDMKLNPLQGRSMLLGSAGKNDTSGDLDLNLDIETYDQTQVTKQLISLLGSDHVKPRPGNNQIFTAVPVSGDPILGYVQIDFMFGDTAWQRFSYYSPAKVDSRENLKEDQSHYKGLYRTELIKALCAFRSDWTLQESQQLVARVGPTFFHDKGVVWRYRYRPMRKDGKARIKEFKELTETEFFDIFPQANKARFDLIRNPVDIWNFLFDSKVPNIQGHESVESLSQLINCHFSDSQRELIYQIYFERLNSLKVVIPYDEFELLGIKVKTCVGAKS